MRIKNITGNVYRENWFSITMRDMVVLGCCLIREQSSLKAFAYVIRNWRRVLEKRRAIMRRKRVSDDYIASWFSYQPVSQPARAAAQVPVRKKVVRS